MLKQHKLNKETAAQVDAIIKWLNKISLFIAKLCELLSNMWKRTAIQNVSAHRLRNSNNLV
jgi:hypothetical protein